MKVGAEEFVKIWQAAESIREVAQKTGLLEQSARSRACRYRKNGVPLKKFLRGRRNNALDWERIKKVAEGAIS
jgi:transposase